jgi:PPOX class probable F420-dependent enzyme
MSAQLPETFRKLLDDRVVAVVSTVMADGSPQSSVVWATYDGDDVLISTIEGRAKERNWRRDPRASVLLYDPANVWTYIEVRGGLTMTTEGGDELIERLSQLYTGERFSGDDGTDHVRVVVRLTPERVITH